MVVVSIDVRGTHVEKAQGLGHLKDILRQGFRLREREVAHERIYG